MFSRCQPLLPGIALSFLVFSVAPKVPTFAIESKRNTSKFGWNKGGVNVFSKNLQYLWNGASKIRPRLLVMTNRKLHSTEINDSGWPYVLCFKIHAISKTTTEISMKIDPHYQRRTCSPMTLVSGNIRFMRIFAWVPWRGDSHHSGAVENVDFQSFQEIRQINARRPLTFGPSQLAWFAGPPLGSYSLYIHHCHLITTQLESW